MVKLVVVNKEDKKIGLEDKLKCHLGKGILHRAFTILVFNKNPKNQVLIQKRSKYKLLWPLTWETTCSSHPSWGADYLATGKKRLKKEFGFNCKLELLGKFNYQARYKDIGSENELCALLIGCYNGKIKPDQREIADYKWVELKTLKTDIKKNPKKYAPWLKPALKIYENSK